MNIRYLAKLANDQAVAVAKVVESQAEVVKALERLERKVNALMKAVKAVKDGRSN